MIISDSFHVILFVLGNSIFHPVMEEEYDDGWMHACTHSLLAKNFPSFFRSGTTKEEEEFFESRFQSLTHHSGLSIILTLLSNIFWCDRSYHSTNSFLPTSTATNLSHDNKTYHHSQSHHNSRHNGFQK